jgi:hypothetical protein
MPATSTTHWLDAHETIDAHDLCRACRITIEELSEIAGYGAPAPLGDASQPLFSADWLMPLRQAVRLRRQYDLDLFAVSILAEHLRRIDALEVELRTLRRTRSSP